MLPDGTPPLVIVSQDKFPEPSVINVCPVAPSEFGNVQITFDGMLSEDLNPM